MKKNREDPVDIVVIGLIIGGIASTILFTLLFMTYVDHPAFTSDTIDPSIFGQYGDVLGGVVGTVLGFLSVYLLFLTYKTQKAELADTRDALKDQKMDSAFFNLLMMFDSIREKHDYSQLHSDMLSVFSSLPNQHSIKLTIHISSGKFVPDLYKNKENIASNSFDHGDLRNEISERYVKFYQHHPEKLGHYFRFIYNIIKYIKESKLSIEKEKRYINLLKAVLSSDELGLLFYNALSDVGKNSGGEFLFKQWLDDYGFLENIDRSSLKHYWHHWFYPRTKFKFLDKDVLDELDIYVNRFLTTK